MSSWASLTGSVTPPWLTTPAFLLGAPFHLFFGPRKFVAIAAFLAVYALAILWQDQVTKTVPEPYLDEVFHIPQAQAYCRGAYDVWDPKLTTPPGLYVFSTILFKVLGSGVCSIHELRRFNVFAIYMTMVYSLDCLTLSVNAQSRKPSAVKSPRTGILSLQTVLTSLNIALFPPLFFFSGLYYTDVLSTCLVLGTYKLFLQRKGAYENSGSGLIWIYVAGMVALTMRQTNIFWVAVYLGGSEAVRTIKLNASPSKATQPKPRTRQEILMDSFIQYSRGNIHDIPLEDAGVADFVLCVLSIAVAILYHPILLLTRLWPYIALLASFILFVFWNGGVVLGDKSNHVATIHIPQLLYLFPFLAFFAAPLIIPSFFRHTYITVTSKFSFWKAFLAALYTALALLTVLSIIHLNTIIHPFTLADNRHYVFYVFRYSILRHPLIRYLLAPIYILCAWVAYLALISPLPSDSSKLGTDKAATTRPPKAAKAQPQVVRPRTPSSSTNTTSTLLLLLIPTALSLITAPLVEPRYFILPWVFYRLHLPAPQSQGDRVLGERSTWLWVETLWFLLINAGTAYMFLYRGFEWPQEPGKVQRFMW